MDDASHGDEIAILIPAFNEATSIRRVVLDFRAVFPAATVYVYDNGSTDDTAAEAASAGAVVRHEPRPGKGHVIRRMFADIDSEVYVIVDGDDTYEAAAAGPMVERLVGARLDLVNGRRESALDANHRSGHRFGNWMLSSCVALFFGPSIVDMLSGFKVLSRRFVKSFPALTSGFEIETEITVHALELHLPVDELPVAYRKRAPGSASKLDTVRDGLRILRLILGLVRTERPMLFFGFFFAVLATVSTSLSVELFVDYRRTGLVRRYPTAVLCTGIMLLAFLSAVCGTVVESVTLGRREHKRMVYLSVEPRSPRSAKPEVL
jgi:glycosyltransferase involved in cell wall biosynthesis